MKRSKQKKPLMCRTEINVDEFDYDEETSEVSDLFSCDP